MENGTHTPLGSGVEFDLIRRLEARWGSRARGLGDDAAILQPPAGEKLVVSTDTSVEAVHFRGEWMTACEIGYRTATAALSDLAAMGARPLGMTLVLTLSERWLSELDGLADGIAEAAQAADCPIVGGDLSRADALHCTYTVLGATARPVHRAGAQVGDVIYVTGALGGPRAALRKLASQREVALPLRERFVHPVARVREGLWLAENAAHSMIDISDGLVSDAEHLAAASEVNLTIDLDRLPVFPGSERSDAAEGGEEYELLVAASATLDVGTFAEQFGLPLTAIGIVGARTNSKGNVSFLSRGARVDLQKGYDHFSR